MGHLFTFVFAIMLLGLTVAALVLFLLVRLLRGGSNAPPSEASNEAKMIQELYHGLTRMEERVESLETLLLDKERKEGRQ